MHYMNFQHCKILSRRLIFFKNEILYIFPIPINFALNVKCSTTAQNLKKIPRSLSGLAIQISSKELVNQR